MKRKQKSTHLAKALTLVGIAAMPIISNAQLKVTGLLFGDYAFKTQADSLGARRLGTGGKPFPAEYNQLPKNYSGFNIRRAYLNFDYDINSRIHVEAVLAHESTTPTGSAEVAPDNNNIMFLKYADVRIKQVFTGTDLIIGQQRTPTFCTSGGSEPLWEYRPIERTITDFNRLASSTDLGVGLEGKYLNNNLGYNILYANNQGAKALFESNTTTNGPAQVGTTPFTTAQTAPRLYADVWYKFFDRLEVQMYWDYSCYNFNYDTTQKKYQTVSSTIKPMIAWIQPGLFTIGAEYYVQTNTYAANDVNGVLGVTNVGSYKAAANLNEMRSTTPTGWSIWGHVVIIKDNDTAKVSKRVGMMQDGQKGGILSLFARYDSYDPDHSMTDVLASNPFNRKKGIYSTSTFITAGLDWEPMKAVHIMPNIWIENFTQKYESSELSSVAGFQAQKNGTDMVLRLSAYYNF